MGRPKEWLNFGGKPLLRHIVGIVQGVVQPVVVAARPGQLLPPLPLGVGVVNDRVADRGPLAGLDAGFAALTGRCDAAFVTSCDHPLLKPAFIARLVECLADWPAVVPVLNGEPFPVTAVYRLGVRPILEDVLQSDCLSVRSFADRCGAKFVSAERFADIDPRLDSLTNLNDSAAYEQALRILNPP